MVAGRGPGGEQTAAGGARINRRGLPGHGVRSRARSNAQAAPRRSPRRSVGRPAGSDLRSQASPRLLVRTPFTR